MKTKILIVDDSRVFRSVVEESLTGESDIEVIGSVRNGIKAIEFLSSSPPHLITLDVEMPDMDGLETLKAIQEINLLRKDFSYPMGVIMLSSFTQKGADITIKALEAGAFDFITKPEGKSLHECMEILRRQLLVKIRYFASRLISFQIQTEPATLLQVSDLKQYSPQPATLLQVSDLKQYSNQPATLFQVSDLKQYSNQPATLSQVSDLKQHSTQPVVSSRIKAILIAVSTGGPKALAEMLPRLCEKTEVPIFIIQHMPPTFTQSLAVSLNSRCRYTVKEGNDNEIIQDNHVYIAPGGKHMVLRRKSREILTITNMYPPENGCRPSADMFFRSAASIYQGDVIAIILTGMGNDGTKGAAILKQAGAYIIAQDEGTSVVWGMPRSAKDAGIVDEVLPLGDIPEAVGKRIK